MTTRLRAERAHLLPAPARAATAVAPLEHEVESADQTPPGPGFVLHVGVDDAFGHGPDALRALVEAAETLQELARDLLPKANTFTTLSLKPPTAG
ncbi:hypothetical protein [Pengzhenrongella sp.]|uniref:hypothetical protein n=1 Tax=Pengzhenrongella sp. TaxID=2888820 RepID=UPI002F958FF8